MCTPAPYTNHVNSKIMGINVELLPLCCCNSLNSFWKALHYILECAYRDL